MHVEYVKSDSNKPLDSFVHFLQTMDESSCERLGDIYDEAVHFADPVNEANGLRQMETVYRDLFKQLKQITFRIMDQAAGDPTSFIHWEMSYQFRGKPRKLPGITVLRFNHSGKVIMQQDYWDASKGVYEEFPLMGVATRTLRKIVRVKHNRAVSS